MSATTGTRPGSAPAIPKGKSPAGPDPLSGHPLGDDHPHPAVEGTSSPQANTDSAPMAVSPAGRKTSHGQSARANHSGFAVTADTPAGHESSGTHDTSASRDKDPGRPAAIHHTAPSVPALLLADPVLALAADVLDDLEKVRIANENRLRQLTRTAEDGDGEIRGFGLDESHPDVARLAALVEMLAKAEHQAELNLGRVMRRHPLGPWVAATTGIGTKQGARLIASIGDPYMRPEVVGDDGAVEPPRPRTVSELWAYCGYHVLATPSSHPGHIALGTQETTAGVAARRVRGQKANWSGTARMRAYLVAVSCMQTPTSPYRKVYDDAREHHANAVHLTPCTRCGPTGKPAPEGSPLSAGHKHARALRKVAKEVLKDLWREARRLHGESP
jgi:hypothetical protein